jgi:hypothetical protein
MYKIPKLVHFRSTLILNKSNKTHKQLDHGTQILCYRTECMNMGKTTKKHRKKIQPKKLSMGAERR